MSVLEHIQKRHLFDLLDLLLKTCDASDLRHCLVHSQKKTKRQGDKDERETRRNRKAWTYRERETNRDIETQRDIERQCKHKHEHARARTSMRKEARTYHEQA